MLRTAYDVQLDFALSSSGAIGGGSNNWDSLSANEGDILKEKIKALTPTAESDNNARLISKLQDILFENIWKQRKYTNGSLLSSIIYVMVVDAEENLDSARDARNYSCHPVFKTRKCINDTGSSSGCCMIFIDETGRVYRNWEHYAKSNVLPKGIMIAPVNGTYTINENNEVELEQYLTPRSKVKTKLLNAGDAIAGVGGMASTVPIAAALAFPIATPIMLAATAVAFTTATYSTVRSAMQLTDRGIHSQSLALTDRDARGNWLGLLSGCVGMGATGATKVLTSVSAAGQEISIGTKIVVGGINASSLLLSGTGLANSVYDIYLKINDNEKICGLDVLQLASSLVIFTHSVNNLNIVSKLGSNTNAGTLRRQLSAEIRNNFEKISSGSSTSKLNGRRALDIIRVLNDIPIRDALMNLHKINNNLPAGLTNALQSINSAGQSTAVSQVIPGLADRLTAGGGGGGGEQIEVAFQYLAEELGLKFVQHIMNPTALFDVLSGMARYFSDKVSRFILVLARTFIDEYVDLIDNNVQMFVATETVVYKIFMHCVRNYSSFSYEYLEGKTPEILRAIESYFESLNPVNNANKKESCKYCKGHYYVCSV